MRVSKKSVKELYMIKALQQAKLSLKKDEVPIGAIIVDKDGNILARAYNSIEKSQCQTAHAEVKAIQKACKKTGDWRLNGCVIYVTLEPCLMCMGLIQLSRIDHVIFGADSTLFGYRLLHRGSMPSYAKNLKIEGGIKASECAALLQIFFKSVRKMRKGSSEAKS